MTVLDTIADMLVTDHALWCSASAKSLHGPLRLIRAIIVMAVHCPFESFAKSLMGRGIHPTQDRILILFPRFAYMHQDCNMAVRDLT